MEARRLDDYRRERYLSVEEFARELHISTRTLYKITSGKEVRLTTMRRIAEKLGVHPSQIVEFVPKESGAR